MKKLVLLTIFGLTLCSLFGQNPARYGNLKIERGAAFTKDSKWINLTTNIARLSDKYQQTRIEVNNIKKLSQPTSVETYLLAELSNVMKAQSAQLDKWKKERNDNTRTIA